MRMFFHRSDLPTSSLSSRYNFYTCFIRPHPVTFASLTLIWQITTAPPFTSSAALTHHRSTVHPAIHCSSTSHLFRRNSSPLQRSSSPHETTHPAPPTCSASAHVQWLCKTQHLFSLKALESSSSTRQGPTPQHRLPACFRYNNSDNCI